MPNFDLIIEPNQGQKTYLKELFQYRELFAFLAWRDILVRYKQAFFGASWALFRPLLNMAIFTFLFGRVAQLPSNDISYPLFVLAGMLPWQVFAGATDTALSLLNNTALITKIYFPRMIIPCAQIVVHLLDFSIGLALLILFSLFSGYLGWTFFFLPLFLILLVILCLGTGLWLSALTVQYRDFRLLVPFLVQFSLFVSPVGYGSFLISDQWHWFYAFNPLVGVIDGFRYSLFGQMPIHLVYNITCSIVISLVVLTTGFLYFRRMERTCVDRI